MRTADAARSSSPASTESDVDDGSEDVDTTVSHARPSRRPTTTEGTTSTEVPGEGSKAKEAKATGPLPATRTRSSTTASAQKEVHHRWAREKRSAPDTETLAASPQPTSPSPSRTHASAPSSGSSESRDETESIGRGTVRMVSGVAAGATWAVDMVSASLRSPQDSGVPDRLLRW